MTDPHYDLAVIGAGTAGLIAAQVGAAAGARVALIERERTGGDCLWTGCVPSKALLAAATTAATMRNADRVGIDPVEPTIDWARVAAHVRGARDQIAPQDSPERLGAMGIDVVHGEARFASPRRLVVDGRSIAFRSAVIATGSTPIVPDGWQGADVLTTDTLWDVLEHLPDDLAIVGGGPTGCELAQALARLGHAVSLIESADHPLPRLDPDVGAAVEQQLTADGATIRVATAVEDVDVADGTARIHLAGDSGVVRAPRVIAAVGRRPVTSGLGLDAAGVDTDASGAVRVDGSLRTRARHIFAAGDVVGGPRLTHVAAHHGATAATNALFLLSRKVERRAVPLVVYTDHEVAHVGATVTHARERLGDDVDVIEIGFDEVDRAITDARTDGWLRIVTARRRVVGATIIAPHAGESIVALADVVRRRGSSADVMATLHPYPTYSIAAYQAAARERIASLVDDRVWRVTRPAFALLRAATRVRR